MQYTKKKFTNYPTGNDDIVIPQKDEDWLKKVEEDKKRFASQKHVEKKSAKTVIPFGNRLLVKRKRVGEKLGDGTLYASDETKDRPTDMATVTYVPDHSFADERLLENAEKIIEALTKKAIGGDSDSFESLLKFNHYLKLKSISVGDEVMLSKYVGTDFYTKESTEQLTLVDTEDLIGVIKHDNE